MEHNVEILRLLLTADLIPEEFGHLGVARLAVDTNSYNGLSEPRKRLLSSYLKRQCVGYTDPGGHHHECGVPLEGEALLVAHQSQFLVDETVCCSDCEATIADFARDFERL